MTARLPALSPAGFASDAPADTDFSLVLEPAIAERIGAQRYELWFRGHTRFGLADSVLTVGVPNLHYQEWLTKQFAAAVSAAAAAVFGRPVAVRFRIDPELFRASRAAQELITALEPTEKPNANPNAAPPVVPLGSEAVAAPNGAPPKPARPASAKLKGPAHTPGLFDQITSESNSQRRQSPRRRWRHLPEFVVGACTRVAFAAAASVVEEVGQGPNPLLLHGPVGTGKTHLLEGIYAGIKRRDPSLHVLFLGAEQFTNRFVAAMRFGKQSAFRRHFRSCDVLLLDDVNFLAKKRATQEEFLHTVDALLDDGRQVVLACDCHPRLNEDFLPELLDRLLGGASWGLQPPDADTRLAILRAKASAPGRARNEANPACAPAIPDEVLRFLAESLRGNVRELEGALHCLRHYRRVVDRTIDVALAREALGELLRHAVRVVHIDDVNAAVCAVLRLPARTLQGKERSWSVSHPRMLATFLCRKHTAASYGEISKHFGGKSHSTAVAAEKTVRQWLQQEQNIAAGGREWSVRDLVERIEREMLK